MSFPHRPARVASDPPRDVVSGRRDALKALGAACLGAATPAAAQLTIEIIGGGSNQIPLTLVPFGNEERFAQR